MRNPARKQSRAFYGALLVPALVLAGCGPSDNDPGPGGVSVGEARALDEAAEMIEARRLPPGTLNTQTSEQPGEQPGEQPEAPDTREQAQEEPAE